MLKIRMQRTGRVNKPTYSLVVLEHARAAKAGKIVEQVGSYDPHTKSKILKTDRIKYWMSVGAQPTPTVHNLLVSEKIVAGKKINVLPKFVAPEKPAEEEKPVAAPAAPAAEAAPVAAPEAPVEAPAEEVAPAVEETAPAAEESSAQA